MKKVDIEELTILTVDDSPFMLNILRECLSAFGAKKIMEAHDAVEAFEIIRANTVDLVIVDYLMHPLDGTEFLQIMRSGKDVVNREMPIILLTAHTERKKILAGRDSGASEILQKPISAAKLYDRIVSVMNSKREFVDAHSFKGPDRRRRRDSDTSQHDGLDRRS